MEGNLHNDYDLQQEKELFVKLKVPWERTKDDVWGELSKKMQQPAKVAPTPRIQWWKMAAAAILVICFGSVIFMRTYTTSQHAFAGQHASLQLPDGSSVKLNAGSEVSFKPYWWWQSRKVDLNGEAFFEVQKGEKFQVVSVNGTTEVLGTSFNIFSRGQRYEVTCLTGKVKVQAMATENALILHPKEKAVLDKSGQFSHEKDVNVENVKAWIAHRLVFTSAPLKDVFEEIERQYKVKITVPKGLLSYTYTGSFKKGNSPEEALQMVCKPFRLDVRKQSPKRFRIIKQQ